MTDTPRPVRAASSKLVSELAERAGIEVVWKNAQHQPQRVSDEVLRVLLDRLGLPCTSTAQARESLALLDAEQRSSHLPLLITAEVGRAIALPVTATKSGTRYRIDLEQGGMIEGMISVPKGERAMLSPVPESGYHTLTLNDRRCTLAVAPTHCFGVADAMRAAGRVERPDSPGGRGARGWGIGVQLYGLREPGDGGIGTYSALGRAAQQIGRAGGDVLALSPVHAMFSAEPHKFSPYSPSSRLFLNVLHIDPAEAFGTAAVQAAIHDLRLGGTLADLESRSLIDWPQAASARLSILRRLFDGLRAGQFGNAPGLALDTFRRRGGHPLEDHARFEVIQGALLAQSPDQGYWRNWPPALRDPASPAVAEAVAATPDEVTFHVFLQWLAERGLARARAEARAAGMAVGLVADLAVGCDSAGSHAWSYPREMLKGVSVGAPPDLFNQSGQAWGLTTFSPRGMVTQGFSAFLDMLRAAFAHAGGLRIDHILGLRRLWLVPDGSSARDGAYLHCPFEDLMRLIALESWRHRAIVIGEDLGTVPSGMRERLADNELLGIRVLWFERRVAKGKIENKADEQPKDSAMAAAPPAKGTDELKTSPVEPFIEPAKWSTHAVATTTTHDLPTIKGWWAGDDIDWRDRIGQTARPAGSDEDPVARAHLERVRDRGLLWAAFQQAGLAPAGVPPPAEAPVDEALAFITLTAAPLVIYPLEDLLGLAEQPNLPGSTDEHPNWRRRIAAPLDALLEEPMLADRLLAIRNLFQSL
ncbi:4-alpha-glucanotransferase [Pararobbsia alpina]|uniref:4-alpha-glucanotransferase n=1 Tax=Pararobbsia alpina TaxID=621374 RepID=A0A6S7B333_9BURK|nr:4-alpha-glucanotransferase [Pararobbsia alpina]CAB3786015.1 4-alpha-glucanotransferase [Pararobbsia alpina]